MPSEVGPLPRFAEVHLHMALELIAEHRKIGRKELAGKLGVGEGSMRTILNQLKKQQLITSSRVGHALTEKGKLSLGKPRRFVRIDAGDLTVGEFDVATLVKNAANEVKLGIEQRDAAIKAGAKGATVLVFKGGKFRFPDGSMDVGQTINDSLVKLFDPSEGDVLVAGSASGILRAEAGARAAAESLITTRALRT